jgi:hypothetical protein
MSSPQAWKTAVDDIEDEVVEIFSSGCPHIPVVLVNFFQSKVNFF